jgi:hypothetical protein
MRRFAAGRLTEPVLRQKILGKRHAADPRAVLLNIAGNHELNSLPLRRLRCLISIDLPRYITYIHRPLRACARIQ